MATILNDADDGLNPRDLRWIRQHKNKKGVGGARFLDVPGVKYPDEVLSCKNARGARVRDKAGKVLTQPKKNWLTTAECASLLGCTLAAARLTMMRAKARRDLVKAPHEVPRLYWDNAAVAKLLDDRLPLLKELPEGAVSSDEACAMLGVCRSSVFRYVKRGYITESRCRLFAPNVGTRKVCFYDRKELEEKLPFFREMKEHYTAQAMKPEQRFEEWQRRQGGFNGKGKMGKKK